MLNGPLLVTERLILRPPAAEDFDAFAEMCAEEETMTFIGGSCARPQAWRQWCSADHHQKGKIRERNAFF